MHAKVSSTGSKFFAHDTQAPGCPALGESAEHRELKRTIADLVRSLGCKALVEATPAPSDRGGWRADVLGVALDGKRVAFEVQLAGMTVADGQTRTQRYTADDIACVWVSTRHTRWMTQLPSCHLVRQEATLLADRGLARTKRFASWYVWEAAEPVEFRKVAGGLLNGRIVTVDHRGHQEFAGGRCYYTEAATLLVSQNDAALFARQEAQRRREADDRARHVANLAALYERQERVLQHAVEVALRAGIATSHLWLGVPPTRWDGSRPLALAKALGDENTAQGAAIWVGPGPNDLRLWAVICPVANRARHGMGALWRHDAVRVFVETLKEANRVGLQLGWQRSEFTITCPSSSIPGTVFALPA